MTLYPPNLLKRKLAAKQPALGHWLSLNSLAGTETAAGAGSNDHEARAELRFEQRQCAASFT